MLELLDLAKEEWAVVANLGGKFKKFVSNFSTLNTHMRNCMFFSREQKRIKKYKYSRFSHQQKRIKKYKHSRFSYSRSLPTLCFNGLLGPYPTIYEKNGS